MPDPPVDAPQLSVVPVEVVPDEVKLDEALGDPPVLVEAGAR